MARRSRSAFLLLTIAAAGAAFAAHAGDEPPPTVFELIDEQGYELPDDAPDELLGVPSKYYARETISLRKADVISAWTTTDSPDGSPSVMVYRCARGAAGRWRWSSAPEAWLTPLGVDVTEQPDLLPFTATHTLIEAPGSVFGPALELGFTIDAQARAGRAPALPTKSQLAVVEEAIVPGADDDDLPLARLRKTHGLRIGMYQDGGFEHADYVLRLNTDGGAGPAAGTACSPGEPVRRVPFRADYWFVHVPFIPAEKDAGADDAG